MQENLKELNNNRNTEYTTFTKFLGEVSDFNSRNIEQIRKLLDISFDMFNLKLTIAMKCLKYGEILLLI